MRLPKRLARLKRPRTAGYFAAIVLAAAAACCVAQTAMPMGDMQPIPPPEQLPTPIRMTGIGNSHIEIKASPEVQAWFDQGLSLLHDFWEYESAKAFEQAIRLDANCAMCWWGLAQAERFREMDGHYYSNRAVAEAVRLKNHANAEGKLYIEALAAQSAGEERRGTPTRIDSNQDSQAVSILRTLVRKNPHDIEARIFLAVAVEDGFDDAGEPKPGQKEGISILEGVLRDAPNDSAANHYWIHAIEPGNHPERALNSAALLASLAPTSGHMVHMPGHIYFRVGNYPEAERWFSASMAADERYMREQHVSVDDDWNYVHNMMYAIANLMEQGKLEAANELSDRLAGARGKLSESLYIWSARDQMARINYRLPVALRVADWNVVLMLLDQANLPDNAKTTNLRFLAEELTDYSGGMKALESGDVAAAQAASDRMDAGLWRQQRDQAAKKDASASDKPGAKKDEKKDQPPIATISPDALPGPLVDSLSITSEELRAGILVAKGRLDDGKKLYATALHDEKKLGYHEPPFYIRPVGENEAAALLKAGDYAGAKTAYETALSERPNSGFALFGLARVKELSGDAAGARQAYADFLKTWPAADASLPQVAHAHEVLGKESLAAR
jgi:tetratricopeptide (TPR) repeat protein